MLSIELVYLFRSFFLSSLSSSPSFSPSSSSSSSPAPSLLLRSSPPRPPSVPSPPLFLLLLSLHHYKVIDMVKEETVSTKGKQKTGGPGKLSSASKQYENVHKHSEVCKLPWAYAEVQPNCKAEIRIAMTSNSLASFQTLFRDKKCLEQLCKFEIDASIDGKHLEREK